MIWLNKILEKIFRKDPVVIKLPVFYTVNTNAYVFETPDWMIDDIRCLAMDRISHDTRLLNKIKKVKLVEVKFHKSIPLGMSVQMSRLFYWNNEQLYDIVKDSESMNRDIKLDTILK